MKLKVHNFLTLETQHDYVINFNPRKKKYPHKIKEGEINNVSK